jgi:hypothetical protein
MYNTGKCWQQKIAKMATSIQISKKNTIPLPEIHSLKLVLQAINAVNMPSKVFIKQRTRNFAKDQFDDTFVAVCTPAQLEDLAEDAPDKGTSYFRTDTIELIIRTPETLEDIFQSVLYEVQKLATDLDSIEQLSQEKVYTLSSEGPLLLTPSAPTITSIAGGDGELSVSFTQPLADGGSNILNYEYSLNNELLWRRRTPANPYPPIKIYGLSNSETYLVKIRAVNSSGAGAASLGMYAAPAVPGRPSKPIMTAIYLNEDEQLVLEFKRPINLAGSTISAYQFSLDGGTSWQTSLAAVGASKIVVDEIIEMNQMYNVSVRALTTSGNYGEASLNIQYMRSGFVGSIFTGDVDSNWTNLANWITASREPATVYPAQYTQVILESNCTVNVDSEIWVEPETINIATYDIVFNSTANPHPIISCNITASTGTATFNGVDYGII